MSEQINPYLAPAAALEETVPAEDMRHASNGIRFFTLLIDYVGFVMVTFVVGMIAALVGPAALEAMQFANGYLVGWGLYLGYYVFFEAIWGRTPGKFILGTIVVTDEGKKPGMMTIVKRSLCRFIPFEAFSFFGERGWHDSITDTVVIRTR
jgi:uncharacterized RDD family membrane protein YckC